MLSEQLSYLGKLARAPDQRRRLHGQVACVQAAQRRELILAELVEPQRLGNVLQAVPAEVAKRQIRIEQFASRVGEQHLAAVRGRADTRAQLHVKADVAFRADARFARVDPDAGTESASGQRALEVGGGGDRVRCPIEGDEERIALHVHLDPALPGDQLPQ